MSVITASSMCAYIGGIVVHVVEQLGQRRAAARLREGARGLLLIPPVAVAPRPAAPRDTRGGEQARAAVPHGQKVPGQEGAVQCRVLSQVVYTAYAQIQSVGHFGFSTLQRKGRTKKATKMKMSRRFLKISSPPPHPAPLE